MDTRRFYTFNDIAQASLVAVSEYVFSLDVPLIVEKLLIGLIRLGQAKRNIKLNKESAYAFILQWIQKNKKTVYTFSMASIEHIEQTLHQLMRHPDEDDEAEYDLLQHALRYLRAEVGVILDFVDVSKNYHESSAYFLLTHFFQQVRQDKLQLLNAVWFDLGRIDKDIYRLLSEVADLKKYMGNMRELHRFVVAIIQQIEAKLNCMQISFFESMLMYPAGEKMMLDDDSKREWEEALCFLDQTLSVPFVNEKKSEHVIERRICYSLREQFMYFLDFAKQVVSIHHAAFDHFTCVQSMPFINICVYFETPNRAGVHTYFLKCTAKQSVFELIEMIKKKSRLRNDAEIEMQIEACTAHRARLNNNVILHSEYRLELYEVLIRRCELGVLSLKNNFLKLRVKRKANAYSVCSQEELLVEPFNAVREVILTEWIRIAQSEQSILRQQEDAVDFLDARQNALGHCTLAFVEAFQQEIRELASSDSAIKESSDFKNGPLKFLCFYFDVLNDPEYSSFHSPCYKKITSIFNQVKKSIQRKEKDNNKDKSIRFTNHFLKFAQMIKRNDQEDEVQMEELCSSQFKMRT